ncbi:CBS domain-containing protein [Haloarcula marina]|uniref:CBS domain-containing protein n=1 Tax=Haloarcula marina TaxID=2961574 RepID=UPI0020B8624D|nr:CBS domain-containing protein [Halomicroarcula marina]
MTNDQTLVEDIMTTPLVTIRPDASIVEAAATMRDKDISALLVTTAPASIITSTDILDAVAKEQNTAELVVSDLMTESVETVPPDLPLGETAAMMTNFGINHLPVVDDDYVGMVSSSDITKQLH